MVSIRRILSSFIKKFIVVIQFYRQKNINYINKYQFIKTMSNNDYRFKKHTTFAANYL